MMYIRRIFLPSGEAVSARVVNWEHKELERFTYELGDTERPHVYVRRGATALSPIQTVGYGVDTRDNERCVVAHSEKEVKLLSFVNAVDFDAEKRLIHYMYCDFASHHRPVEVVSNNIISIDLDGLLLYASGYGCSVITTRSRTQPLLDCYSLYNFLVFLCKYTEMNVMQYETIQVYSSRYCYRFIIRLVHSDQADRFFLKMRLTSQEHSSTSDF